MMASLFASVCCHATYCRGDEDDGGQEYHHCSMAVPCQGAASVVEAKADAQAVQHAWLDGGANDKEEREAEDGRLTQRDRAEASVVQYLGTYLHPMRGEMCGSPG